MDDSSSASLIVILVLVTLKALLTLGYAALINLRLSTLQEQANEGHNGARRALQLLQTAQSKLVATVQLASVLLVSLAVMITTVELVLPILQEDSPTPLLLGILGVLGVSAAITILADIVPEGIGSTYAQPIAMLLVGPIGVLVTLFSPITNLTLSISRLLSRLFGSSARVNTVTEEEIMTLVNAGYTGGTIEDEEKEMIYSILTMDQTHARELMVPRPDVIALDVETPIPEALKTFIDTGYSRIPVYEENIDNIAGLLYAKDLLTLWRTHVDKLALSGSIRDQIRPAYFVPEMQTAAQLLKELQNRKVHMAVVVDEYGGTSGIVTIENLIEEIVGDIQDEYDENEEAEYRLMDSGDYLIDASMDLDDLNNLLNIDLDTDETDTLGGFIFLKLGRVPDAGEVLETEELLLQVLEIDGRRIRKVLLTRKPSEDGDTTSSANSERRDEQATPEDADSVRVAADTGTSTGGDAQAQPNSNDNDNDNDTSAQRPLADAS